MFLGPPPPPPFPDGGERYPSRPDRSSSRSAPSDTAAGAFGCGREDEGGGSGSSSSSSSSSDWTRPSPLDGKGTCCGLEKKDVDYVSLTSLMETEKKKTYPTIFACSRLRHLLQELLVPEVDLLHESFVRSLPLRRPCATPASATPASSSCSAAAAAAAPGRRACIAVASLPRMVHDISATTRDLVLEFVL